MLWLTIRDVIEMVWRIGIVDQLLKQPTELPSTMPSELINTTKDNANTVVLDLRRHVLMPTLSVL